MLTNIIILLVILCIIYYYYYYYYNNKCSQNLNESFIGKNIKYSYKGYNDILKDYSSIKYTKGGIPKIIIKTSWQKRDSFPKQLNIVLNFINLMYYLNYLGYYFGF